MTADQAAAAAKVPGQQPDRTIRTMLDAVNLPALEAHAGEAQALAGYVNGRWPTFPALVSKYGKTGKYLLSIDVQGNPALGAQALDVESGDATIAQAPGWTKETQAEGKKARDGRWFPKLYSSISGGNALIAALAAAGIRRDEYMYWSAHYTPGYPHICGPSTCRQGPQADATQWTDAFDGGPVDGSQCFAYFFSGPPALIPEVRCPAGQWTALPGKIVQPASHDVVLRVRS
ncbi:MAG TPA: hypothetical protein VK599_07095 [Streptosporangiaceae bacterium]|nr:hypothetical protein [Streptosporangiaceae bacterium]